tara:strand:- start:1224 stop:1511 length:288 start_codon:yes stop_codon:yes gene_type:complete
MDNQFLFNAVFGVVSLLGGWVFKMAWSRMTSLDDDLETLQKHHEEDLKEVRREMADLALSLPEKYVSKQDLDKLEDFINERFNKLEHKIDQLNKS